MMDTRRVEGNTMPSNLIFFDYDLFNRLSANAAYRIGTTNVVSIANTIPPNEGMAIGTITSEPLPTEVKTGIRARMVVAVVIMAGRILRLPASTVASRIS